MSFIPADKKKAAVEMKVYDFKGAGVLMGMYNTDDSI
jgi:hypothetical protein